jgi:hypothetical protein
LLRKLHGTRMSLIYRIGTDFNLLRKLDRIGIEGVIGEMEHRLGTHFKPLLFG